MLQKPNTYNLHSLPLKLNKYFKLSTSSTPQAKPLPLSTTYLYRSPLKKQVQYYQRIERYNLLRNCKTNYYLTEIESINRIIYNDYTHPVSVFKDFLIYDDIKELLTSFYTFKTSRMLLKDLVNERQKKFVCFTFRLCENTIIKKGMMKKEKVKKIKEEDMKGHESVSTFFCTTFITSLAKEDLSSSISRLPTISLDCADKEDTENIGDLLKKLNNKEDEQKRQVIALNHANVSIKTQSRQKKLEQSLKQAKRLKIIIKEKRKERLKENSEPLNKDMLKCKIKRVTKTSVAKRNQKPFTSNGVYSINICEKYYVKTDRKEHTLESSHNLNKIVLKLSKEIKTSINRNPPLSKFRSNLRAEEVRLLNTLPNMSVHSNKERTRTKQNYFAIYNKRGSNVIELKSPHILAKFVENVSKTRTRMKECLSNISYIKNTFGCSGEESQLQSIPSNVRKTERIVFSRETPELELSQPVSINKYFS